MRRILTYLYHGLVLYGIDPLTTLRAIRGTPIYLRNFVIFCWQARRAGHQITLGKPHPCLSDRYAQSGYVGGHYFYQDLHVARRIFQNKPKIHVDVASRIDGFVAHVASFRSIEVLDIRPLSASIPNVTFTQCNIMENLDKLLVECCDSLSCLHALEHFGLGRYGDPIDFNGHVRGFNNLSRILKPSGKFYLSAPIGPQRVEFDGQRIFSVSYLVKLIERDFQIDAVSIVNDVGEFTENVDLCASSVANNFDCQLGCGIFELTKSK